MKKAFDQYQRLAKSPLGMSSVWMGEDHLVYVIGSGLLLPFKETYRRYNYRDIQYLAVSRKNKLLLTVVFGLILLFFIATIAALIALISRGVLPANLVSIGGLGVSSLGAGAALWLLLRHQVLGPACACDIKTNLKRDRLKPLNRLHQAEQAIALLGDVIESQQAYLVESQQAEAESAIESVASRLRRRQEQVRVAKPVLPAFIIYTGMGAIGLLALHVESIALVGAALALIVIGNTTLVASLVQSYRFQSPEPIRTMLLTLLALVLILGATAVVYFINMVVVDPIFISSITAPLEAFAGMVTLGGVGYYLIFLAVLIAILILAATGVVQTLKWRSRMAKAVGNDSEVVT